ncbi:hypothetical protein GCM10027188_20340 [Lysobacter humi (ex Lee et al. 2017)]
MVRAGTGSVAERIEGKPEKAMGVGRTGIELHGPLGCVAGRFGVTAHQPRLRDLERREERAARLYIRADLDLRGSTPEVATFGIGSDEREATAGR